jgi:hypothetical protein
MDSDPSMPGYVSLLLPCLLTFGASLPLLPGNAYVEDYFLRKLIGGGIFLGFRRYCLARRYPAVLPGA